MIVKPPSAHREGEPQIDIIHPSNHQKPKSVASYKSNSNPNPATHNIYSYYTVSVPKCRYTRDRTSHKSLSYIEKANSKPIMAKRRNIIFGGVLIAALLISSLRLLVNEHNRTHADVIISENSSLPAEATQQQTSLSWHGGNVNVPQEDNASFSACLLIMVRSHFCHFCFHVVQFYNGFFLVSSVCRTIITA